MNPSVASRALQVMAVPMVPPLYAAEPCAPACEPLATPQANPAVEFVRQQQTEPNRTNSEGQERKGAGT